MCVMNKETYTRLIYNTNNENKQNETNMVEQASLWTPSLVSWFAKVQYYCSKQYR